MATTYKFQIGDDTIPYSASSIIKIASVEYKMSLRSLRYHKKMFQPGLIEAKLQLTQNTNDTMKAPAMDDLVAYFKTQKNNVSLTKTVDGVEKTIAQDYYVYKVLPTYKRQEKNQYVQVLLMIYSPDHKLTLDKYCRTYSNRKLATDIITASLNATTKSNPLSSAGFTDKNVDTSHMKFLNYITAVNGDKITCKEFIQPYLVQYNESFYDFLARTANRCGEFFYYESGKLYLGVNDFSDAPAVPAGTVDHKSHVDLDRDIVLSFSFENSDEEIVGTNNYYYNSLQEKKDNDVAFSYNNELPLNEYLDNIVTKDEYTNLLNEFFPKGVKSLPDALSALNTGGISGVVAWVVSTVLSGIFFASGMADAKNKKYNENWVDDSEPKKNKNNYDDRYDKSSSKATLYGSQLTKDVKQKNYEYGQNINDVLYNFISTGCQTVSGGLISVSLGSEHIPLLLGQDVTFESKSEVSAQEATMTDSETFNFEHYIVVDVAEVIKSEEANLSKEEWQLGQKVTIAPLYNVKAKLYNESTEKTLKIACPPLMCPIIRTSGPQRAFVTENVDPKGFGRVRIKYPWQSSSDDESPFIRMAVPYVAAKGENRGGFYFQPGEGTEVLVDYENGNMERPYVIGSLYNAQSKAPRDGYNYASWSPSLHPEPPTEPLTISSWKGHKIKLDDNGNFEDFLISTVPAVNLLKPLWKKLPENWRLDQDGNSCFSGGISLTDKWGLYKIECSTTNRSISVNSPFGDIKLNAFTGITINAPNGDVKISGKNVSISASNEVKILSGLAIYPPGYSTFRDTILKGITGAITDIALQAVDLRLIRTVVEIFAGPATGTMTLKSNRYLLLGAGRGKPEIPSKGYSVKGVTRLESGNDRIQLVKQISTMSTNVDKYYAEIFNEYKSIRDAMPEMQEFIKDDQWATWRDSFVKGQLKDSATTLNVGDLPLKDELGEDRRTDALNKAKSIQGKVVNIFKESTKHFKEAEGLTIKSHSKLLQKDNYEKVAKKEAPKTQITLIKNILAKMETFKLTDEDLVAARIDIKAAKRSFAYHFIKDTYSVEYANGNVPEPTFISMDDFIDDIKWLVWVSGLHHWTGKSAAHASEAVIFLKEVKDEALSKAYEYSGISYFTEKDIWGVGAKGEILMADKDNAVTMSFQNGAVVRNENTEGYTTKVKQMLSRM